MLAVEALTQGRVWSRPHSEEGERLGTVVAPQATGRAGETSDISDKGRMGPVERGSCMETENAHDGTSNEEVGMMDGETEQDGPGREGRCMWLSSFLQGREWGEATRAPLGMGPKTDGAVCRGSNGVSSRWYGSMGGEKRQRCASCALQAIGCRTRC